MLCLSCVNKAMETWKTFLDVYRLEPPQNELGLQSLSFILKSARENDACLQSETSSSL